MGVHSGGGSGVAMVVIRLWLSVKGGICGDNLIDGMW